MRALDARVLRLLKLRLRLALDKPRLADAAAVHNQHQRRDDPRKLERITSFRWPPGETKELNGECEYVAYIDIPVTPSFV